MRGEGVSEGVSGAGYRAGSRFERFEHPLGMMWWDGDALCGVGWLSHGHELSRTHANRLTRKYKARP